MQPDDSIDVIGSFRDPLARSISSFLHSLNVKNYMDEDIYSERSESYFEHVMARLRSIPPDQHFTHYIAAPPQHPALWHLYQTKQLPTLTQLRDIFVGGWLPSMNEYISWINMLKSKLNLTDVPVEQIENNGVLSINSQLSNGCKASLRLTKFEALNNQVIQQLFRFDRQVDLLTRGEKTSSDSHYLFKEDIGHVYDVLKTDGRNHPGVRMMYQSPTVQRLGYTCN